jgi:hypothetical protein
MCNNIENVYKRLTGVDPTKLEPPLTGQTLITEIQRLRRNPKPLVLNPAVINGVEIYESETDPKKEPFTVLTATLTDGSTVGCYVFAHPPEKKELLKYAREIPTDQWFPFDLNQPSASGV